MNRHRGCLVILVVHQRSCRCVGVDIKSLQSRHILEGVVRDVVCQFLMDGHRRQRLRRREEVSCLQAIEDVVLDSTLRCIAVEDKGLLHLMTLWSGYGIDGSRYGDSIHLSQILEDIAAESDRLELLLVVEVRREGVVDDEVSIQRSGTSLLERDVKGAFVVRHDSDMSGNGVSGILAHVSCIGHVEAVAYIIAQEHLQLRIAVEGIDIMIAREGVFIIIIAKQQGLLELFLRTRRNLVTPGVAAAAIITGASHTIIAVEVEVVDHRLTIALTGNGSVAIVAMMDDFSAEVTMINA